MRIKAASEALSVPVPTLRRWTQEFATGLSPEARASDGRPREFTPRDMRVLRRAKEVLSRDDVTYERARRDLAAEGLLTYARESDQQTGTPARDDVADREAAETFVREVVERSSATMRDAHAQLAARVVELERELRALRAELEHALAPAPGETGPSERRRGWFR